MLWLGEIDGLGPLIVALRREIGIPISYLIWVGQVRVELIDYELAFVGGGE